VRAIVRGRRRRTRSFETASKVRGTDCKTKPFGLAELRLDDDLVVGKRCFVPLEVGFE